MKIFYILLLFTCFISCHNDDSNNLEFDRDYTVEIESYYKLENDEKLYIDINTDVFIYYGIYTGDIAGYTIDENGILTVSNKKIYPNKHYKIDKNAKCQFLSDQPDDKMTLLVRSNFYKDKISQYSFPYTNSNIDLKIVASP